MTMKTSATLLLAALLTLLSCSSGEANLSTVSSGFAELSEPSSNPEAETAAVRKLVHDAELSVEVAAYVDARRVIDEQLTKVGGFIQSARVQHHEGRVSSAHLVMSIPSASLGAVLQACTGLGNVAHESLTSQDVTEQHFDMQARLTTARKLESRLMGLVETQAHNLKDLLEVERELARVRETIERLDGKLLRLDQQIAFSTLTLQLTTRHVFAAGVPLTLADEIGDTFMTSITAIVGLGRSLLLILVGIIPWALPLALLVWLALRFQRGVSRRAKLAGDAGAE